MKTTQLCEALLRFSHCLIFIKNFVLWSILHLHLHLVPHYNVLNLVQKCLNFNQNQACGHHRVMLIYGNELRLLVISWCIDWIFIWKMHFYTTKASHLSINNLNFSWMQHAHNFKRPQQECVWTLQTAFAKVNFIVVWKIYMLDTIRL
jgi:hypothetical protein